MSKGYFNPDVVGRIAAIGLKARLPMEGSVSGMHRSPLHGLSPEFADHRAYYPGDDLRNIDWKVLGRTDRYYVKRFEEESNLRAHFFVDASRSMNYGADAAQPNSRSKFDVASTIAVAMAAVLLKQRDSVGFSAVSTTQSREHRPSSLSSQLPRMVELLEGTVPDGETDLGKVVSGLAERLPRRGLVVILSDLLTPLDHLYESLGKLQHSGHEVLLLHILHRDELELPFDDSVIFRDIEGNEELFAEPWAFRAVYREAMEQFSADVRQRCQFCGIDYLQILTDEEIGLRLSHFLHARQFTGPQRHRGNMSLLRDDPSPTTPPTSTDRSDTPPAV
ncbi:MAG: DUF58 domain-containing protein [Planctomycetaceae bacterium]